MARSVWICVDCGTEIEEVGRGGAEHHTDPPPNTFFECCWRCGNWEPEVVIAYR